MITKIELTNFMSHAHTVIEPAAGLTVLVGANNVGKSAVVAALQILCHNDNSTYVLRHGEKQCSIQVETDDGHVVEWRRKNSPSYVIDGQTFDRLGIGGTPEELHRALRLPKVDAGSDADFDVHFGTQKSPIFLLGSSPANAARFFASSSDASRLVKMQKLHKDKLGAAQKEKARLEGESRVLNAELELLEPVVEIDRRLERIELTYQEIVLRDTWFEEAAEQERSMRAQADEVARQDARASAIATLHAPPILASTEPLTKWIAELREAEQKCRSAVARTAALMSLAVPPDVRDESGLAQLTAAITAITRRSDQAEREAKALDDLSIPPAPADTNPLAELLVRLQTIAVQVATCEAGLADAESSVAAAAEELRAKATGSSCSTCGSPLDPDRVVARAAAGLGVYDHD